MSSCTRSVQVWPAYCISASKITSIRSTGTFSFFSIASPAARCSSSTARTSSSRKALVGLKTARTKSWRTSATMQPMAQVMPGA